MPKLYLLLLTLYVFLPILSSAQSFGDNIDLSFGMAFSQQDKRLSNYPERTIDLENEDSWFDYTYSLSLRKSIIRKERFDFRVGIGYASFNSSFSRSFHHSQLTGDFTQIARHIKRYNINSLAVPISYHLLLIQQHRLFLKLDLWPQTSYRRSVLGVSGKRFTKWGLDLQSLSLYPGVGLQVAPQVQITAQYRMLYLYEVDNAIFNTSAYHEHLTGFLRRIRSDNHNPFQLWFTVSYGFN